MSVGQGFSQEEVKEGKLSFACLLSGTYVRLDACVPQWDCEGSVRSWGDSSGYHDTQYPVINHRSTPQLNLISPKLFSPSFSPSSNSLSLSLSLFLSVFTHPAVVSLSHLCQPSTETPCRLYPGNNPVYRSAANTKQILAHTSISHS